MGRVRVASIKGHRSWALRFLTGRYQGGMVPLEEGRELTIGRLPEAGLSLPEELTSRRHARIVWDQGVPVVEDLGSTNGTFVNGERVKRRPLAEGDRLLVGSNILKLVTEVRPAPLDADTMPGLERAAVTPAPRRATAMQGRLEEVGLPDVLQLFGTSRKSGVLNVVSGERRGAVYLVAGRVTHCFVEGSPGLPPEEAFVELLQWTEGAFELGAPPAEPPPGAPLGHPVEALLIEGLRRLDERRRRP
jgi:pSer/pThr/pTyr-binding forkhead associated (FHA) protein